MLLWTVGHGELQRKVQAAAGTDPTSQAPARFLCLRPAAVDEHNCGCITPTFAGHRMSAKEQRHVMCVWLQQVTCYVPRWLISYHSSNLNLTTSSGLHEIHYLQATHVSQGAWPGDVSAG
jgi:hypothetical protein